MAKTKATGRVGITRFVGNIVDDTKEFLDDVLDRARDTERDLRDSAVRTLRYDDAEDDPADIEALQAELERLSARIAALSGSDGRASGPAAGGTEH